MPPTNFLSTCAGHRRSLIKGHTGHGHRHSRTHRLAHSPAVLCNYSFNLHATAISTEILLAPISLKKLKAASLLQPNLPLEERKHRLKTCHQGYHGAIDQYLSTRARAVLPKILISCTASLPFGTTSYALWMLEFYIVRKAHS